MFLSRMLFNRKVRIQICAGCRGNFNRLRTSQTLIAFAALQVQITLAENIITSFYESKGSTLLLKAQSTTVFTNLGQIYIGY